MIPFPGDLDDALNDALDAKAEGGGFQGAGPGDLSHDAIAWHNAVDCAYSKSRRAEPSSRVWNDVISECRKNGAPAVGERRTYPISARTRHQNEERAPRLAAYNGWVGHGLPIPVTAALIILMLLGMALVRDIPNASDDHPNDQNYLAAIQPSSPIATPSQGAQICDVEPLTVDQVMERVLNPVAVVTGVESDVIKYSEAPINRPPLPGYQDSPEEIKATFEAPDQATFDSAYAAANRFVACLYSGTYGQAWRLIDVPTLQHDILLNFPVVRTEDDIRSWVTEHINNRPLEYRFPNLTLLADGDRQSSLMVEAYSTIPRNHLGNELSTYVILGSVLVDENGEVHARGLPNRSVVSDNLSIGPLPIFVMFQYFGTDDRHVTLYR